MIAPNGMKQPETPPIIESSRLQPGTLPHDSPGPRQLQPDRNLLPRRRSGIKQTLQDWSRQHQQHASA